MAKKKVAVLYGGRSGEHEVSVRSAAAVMENFDDAKYDITPIYINKQGEWAMPLERMREFDVVFPVLHGPNGEDGTVQGLLATMGVRYVGAHVTSSAIGMDKAIFKALMRAHNLPVTDHTVIKRGEWCEHRDDIVNSVVSELGLPVFTKPANMGSSVGIHKCKTEAEIISGVEDSFNWDRKVLIEKAVPNVRELEVAIIGNDPYVASVVGEIVPSHEFYDYGAKYEDGSQYLIPAHIPPQLSDLIRETAIEVAAICDVQGMTRVDFLLDGSARGDSPTAGEIFISEINTIPGFTELSMYPKMLIASGMTYPEILDRLIELAYETN
jgi:D-alanine-D-alanine ligase